VAANDILAFAAGVDGTGRTRWDATKIGEAVREPNPAGTGAAFARTGEPSQPPVEGAATPRGAGSGNADSVRGERR